MVLREEGLASTLADLFAQFDQAYAATHGELPLHMAGSKIVLRSNLSEYLATCDRAMTSVGPADGTAARFLVSCAQEPLCPHLAWGDRYFREREVENTLRSSPYRMHFFSDLGFWQFYDRDTARGWQIMLEPMAYPVWDSGSPLRNLLHWHLAEREKSLIHAGTLSYKGKGILLAGSGGSGKSGTVLAGILNGLATVGDDYVLVDPNRRRAYPLFNTLKQDPDGIARLGLTSARGIPQETNWQGKYQFHLSDLDNMERAEQMDLVAVVLPKIVGSTKSHFEPTSAKEAFLSLAPSGVSQIPGDRSVQARAAAELLRQLPSFRMALSADPAEIASSIQSFLEQF